jgi:hypothetical protein
MRQAKIIAMKTNIYLALAGQFNKIKDQTTSQEPTMADLKEVQKKNAEHIVAQYLLVRKALQNKVNDDHLDQLAATLTAAMWSSDAGARANGLIEATAST